MYIRFVISKLDEGSNKKQGIFQAIGVLRDDGELFQYEEDILKDIHKWFNKNLEKPSSFSKSRKPNAHSKAISWYKNTATKHIAKMYEIVGILEAHDVYVNVIRTQKPGYIVYEDNFQVTAEAVNDTGA